jgi:hypothetical protein
MQTECKTVAQYLASLPDDRRKAMKAVRDVVLKNLPKGYEEIMSPTGIGYVVPHSVYPPGYHCDPKQPLPFVGIASQKNHMAIYLMCVYQDADHEAWFREAWAKSGKKLNMGKSCVRFTKLDDVPLKVIGQAIKRVPVKKFINHYEAIIKSVSDRKKPASSRAPAASKSAKISSGKIKWKLAKGKSWRMKLDQEHPSHGKTVPIPQAMQKRLGKGSLLIPEPLKVDALMRKVRKGKLATGSWIRARLAHDAGATASCALTTGIFINICANTAEEDRAAGKKRITPYWRVIKDDGKLNDKFPGGAKSHAAKLREEGFTIQAGKGKQPPRVKEFDQYLMRP